MDIKMINDNRFDVILDMEDLEKFNIDLSQFMSMTVENFNFFHIILKYIDGLTNFSLKNKKIIFDTFFINNSYFLIKFYIVGITSKIGNFLSKTGKKISVSKNNPIIFSFTTFDTFCDFLNYLYGLEKNKLLLLLNYISFFKYKNNYFIIIKNSIFYDNLFDFIFLQISEFAEFVSCSDISAKKIEEFGENINIFQEK